MFEAVHVDHPDADRCYWVLPNLLPPQHGAASAYIPGIELPDELPIPTPDQVSHLPPATRHRRRRLLGNGVGIRSRAAPLRSRSLRCTTWQLSKAPPSVWGDTGRERYSAQVLLAFSLDGEATGRDPWYVQVAAGAGP